VAGRPGTAAGGQDGGAEVATATAAVTRRDLRATEEVDGTLGYGDTRKVVNGRQGTITALPAEGAVVIRGQALYRVDNRPVPLLYGRLPAWRPLSVGVDDGADVRQLERNLVALGHDPDRKVTVDDHFTWATRAAVRRWQEAAGLEETGTFEPGDAVWQPGPVRAGTVQATVGDAAHPGSPMLEVTSTTRQVSIDLDASRQPYVRAGDRVDLELPGGRTTTGRVRSVGKVATVPSGGDGTDTTPTVELVVSLDHPKATGRLDQAPVDASITTEVRRGVLAVPVNALLALAEGGYAVEVERDGRRQLVGVKTGLFADGQVEIEGQGLRPGDRVVVPL
jgi:peptidoglycan hydrolase-like protein with peptidoglycan-binding domain